MKRIGTSLVAIVAALGFIAVAENASAQSQQVLRVGTVTGTTCDFSAWVMTSAAIDQNMQVQFVYLPFGDLLPALTDKKIDVVASVYSTTPEREKLMDFTEPFFASRDVLVVPASDTKAYKSGADLKGMNVAALRGAIYVDLLKQAGANVTAIETTPQLFDEVDASHYDALMTSGSLAATFLKGDAHPKLKVIESYPALLNSQISFQVQKGNTDLQKKLNASLEKMKADGTIKALAPICGYRAL